MSLPEYFVYLSVTLFNRMNEHSTPFAHELESYRPGLVRLAYGMLGTLDEAEDVVQDVLIKWLEVDRAQIRSIKSYLIRMTMNACINTKNAAHARRLTYPGQWLPEPFYQEPSLPSVAPFDVPLFSYELMARLESLSPNERAVFLLKEAFDFSHDEIAELVSISAENSRQLLRRGKEKIKADEITGKAPFLNANERVGQFITAIRNADVDGLLKLLKQDIALAADGGGKVPSAPAPIVGAEKVVHLLMTAIKKLPFIPRIKLFKLNGNPALTVFNGTQLIATYLPVLDEEGRISKLYAIFNPDKLKRLATFYGLG